jgi:hypothetical protein
MRMTTCFRWKTQQGSRSRLADEKENTGAGYHVLI